MDDATSISRKEFDAVISRLDLSIQRIEGIAGSNAKAIQDLTALTAANTQSVTKLTTDLAVLKDRTRYLYPLLGFAVSVITFLLGTRFA